MKRLHRGGSMRGRRISPTAVIACAALFFSLGEAGLAANSLPSASTLVLGGGQLVAIPPHQNAVAIAHCPAGTSVVSGGGSVTSPSQAYVTMDALFVPPPSSVYSYRRGWQIEAYNNSSNRHVWVQAFVYCH